MTQREVEGDELAGERVDIILWDENPAILAPALVLRTQPIALLVQRRDQALDGLRGLLHSLLRMYHDLGLYPSEFEGRFVDATTRYYAAEAEARLAATDVPTYLRHVDGRLAAEEARVQHYLQPATRRPLRQAAVTTRRCGCSTRTCELAVDTY